MFYRIEMAVEFLARLCSGLFKFGTGISVIQNVNAAGTKRSWPSYGIICCKIGLAVNSKKKISYIFLDYILYNLITITLSVLYISHCIMYFCIDYLTTSETWG